MTSNKEISKYRKTATVVGVLFIIGTVSGILSVIITGPILDDPDYLILIATNKTQLAVGAVCVLTMGLSLAMVPVVIFPILKQQNYVLALGSIVFRGALEGMIHIGIVISWLLLIVLSQEYVNAGAVVADHYQTLAGSHPLGTSVRPTHGSYRTSHGNTPEMTSRNLYSHRTPQPSAC